MAIGDDIARAIGEQGLTLDVLEEQISEWKHIYRCRVLVTMILVCPSPKEYPQGVH